MKGNLPFNPEDGGHHLSPYERRAPWPSFFLPWAIYWTIMLNASSRNERLSVKKARITCGGLRTKVDLVAARP